MILQLFLETTHTKMTSHVVSIVCQKQTLLGRENDVNITFIHDHFEIGSVLVLVGNLVSNDVIIW